MRIISGSQKGRRIYAPVNLPVRPTTDMAKESLFNILNNLIDFEDLSVLDLFAGTGSISFEFASRGAAIVTAVDSNFRCVDFIKKTAAKYNLSAIRVVKADVFKMLKKPFDSYDLVFSDAPYDISETSDLPDLIFVNGWVKKNARLIIEHSKALDFSKHPYFEQKRNYGRVNFSFFYNV